MNEPELRAAVKEFERVIEASEGLSKKGTRLAAILSTFFAMGCASKVRRHFGIRKGDDIEETHESAVIEVRSVESVTLPKFDAVHAAGERLVAGAASQDQAGTSDALAEMGVLALCPIPQQPLTRMKIVARSVTGPAQLIPLIDLSLFAAELEDYGRASKYAVKARAFDPSACELYNLCVVEG